MKLTKRQNEIIDTALNLILRKFRLYSAGKLNKERRDFRRLESFLIFLWVSNLHFHCGRFF